MGVDWSDNITREMIATQFLQIDNTKIVEELQENVNRLEIKVNNLDKAVLKSNVGNGIVVSRMATSSPSSSSSADAVSSPPFATSSPADDEVVSSPSDDEVVSSPSDDVVASSDDVVSSDDAVASPLAKQRGYSPSFEKSPFMDSPVAKSHVVSPVARSHDVTSHPFETSPANLSASKISANLINNSDKSLTSISNSVPPAWLNSEEKKKRIGESSGSGSSGKSRGIESNNAKKTEK